MGLFSRKKENPVVAPRGAPAHVCGRCGKRFATDTAYVEHECRTMGNIKPTNPNFGRR